MNKKMKIEVISDTHIPTAAENLPDPLLRDLDNSYCCIHAGDFVNKETLNEISKRTKLYAVRGNMDSIAVQKTLPEKRTIKIGKAKIGIVHKTNPSVNIQQELKELLGPYLDIYIFGHTHSAFNQTQEGKLFFNPGSPTDKFFAETNSYGIIKIAGEQITAKIINLAN
jgi:uncharacterized protein